MRGFVCLLALIVAAPAAAQTLVDHYLAAMQAREDERFVDYHAEMLRAHAIEPGHAVVQMHLARAASSIGATEEAADWLLRALAQGAWIDVDDDPWLEAVMASDFAPRIRGRAATVGAHRGRGEVGFVLGDGDVLHEGIAHDPTTGRFFLGSMIGRKIVAIDADGAATDFVASGQDGLTATLGLDVDAGRRRLWAVATGDPRTATLTEDEVGTTGVWCWSLDTGELLAHFDAPRDSVDRGFNDVVALADGSAVITDANAGCLWTVDGALTSIDRALADGSLRGPNGIAPAREAGVVYVAEYVYGITRVDLASGDTARLTHPEGVSLIGVDGLALHDDALLVVQNYAGLDRAARFPLATDGRSVTGVEVLDARHPSMDDPTTGVVADGWWWFIANSHVAGFDREKGIDGLAPTTVRRARLEDD